MILETLRVKNFRQYYGEQEVRFASGKRNVTVINGTTGAGKTNLFSAINWCLFGADSGLGVHGEIVNKRALAELGKRRAIAEVDLIFRHSDPDGKEGSYLARRSSEDDTLQLFHVTRRGFEKLPNPSLVLNTILSRDTRSYFFFDGERIDEFAKPEHEVEIKEAIYSVLKLELLQRARSHLDSIADQYESELRKLDTEGVLQELVAEKSEKVKEREEKLGELRRSREELNSTRNVQDALDQELSKQRAVQEDVRRRQALENQQTRIEEQLGSILSDMRSIGSSSYILFGMEIIRKAISIIGEKRRRGEIPSGIREQFIRDLIEKEMCICGRGISKDSAEYETLVRLLDRSLPSPIEDRILETGGLLQALQHKAQERFQALKNLKQDKANLDDELSRATKEADEIGTKLANVGIQEIEELESKRQDASQRISRLFVTIGGLEQRIKDLENDLRELNHKIDKAEGFEGKAKLVQKKLALARQSAEAVEAVHERFASDTRRRIEAETKRNFNSLIWKESQFTSVELTNEYQLKVLDRWNKPARPELSAGERQLLSLSFIIALANVSEDSAPIVMDTPFGRLDTKPRENICARIPEMIEQVILFVTGEELHGEAREILRPYIGREYTLEWQKSTGCTLIVPEGESKDEE